MHIVYIRLRFVLLLSLLLLLLLMRHSVDPKSSGSCHVADVTQQTAKLTMRWAIRNNNNKNNENNDNNLDATIVPIQKSVIMCVWFTRIDNQTTTTTMTTTTTTTPSTTSTHRQQLQSGTHHANCCCCSRCDSDRSQSAKGRISNKHI